MEATDEKQDYQQIFWDFIGIAWRRKFWVLLPCLLAIIASVYLSLTLPKIYRSNTLILVEAQKVPNSIVESAVSGTAQDRLSTIKQQIFSRSFLLKIIDKFSLYENNEPSHFEQSKAKLMAKFGLEQKPLTSGEKVDLLREGIELKTKGRSRLESFSISFSGKIPKTVMDVTNELASLVIEENLRIREGFIEGATDFLVGELNTLKKELEGQEKRFGDYKHAHLGELPGQLDSNLRSLDRFQSNLETIRVSRKSSQVRASDLEKSYKALLRQQEQFNSGGLALESPLGGIATSLPQSPLMQTLRQYQATLSSLLVEYNESYPDVIIVQRKIEKLKKELLNFKLDGQITSRSEEAGNGNTLSRADPAPAMAILDQIRELNDNLKDLNKREQAILKQIKAFELRVENTPKREQEMLTIQRDYNNISKSYQSLLAKKLNAEISENLEKRQKGEQFRIIDPANFPEKPIKPNKPLLLLMGGAIGLGMGIGFAFIREQFDNSIRKPEEVERITSVLVLAMIPDFEDQPHQKDKRQNKVVDIDDFSGRKHKVRRGGVN